MSRYTDLNIDPANGHPMRFQRQSDRLSPVIPKPEKPEPAWVQAVGGVAVAVCIAAVVFYFI